MKIEGSRAVSWSVPRTYWSGSRICNTFYKIIFIDPNKTVFREFNARFKPFRDAQPAADKDSDAVSVRSVSTTASTIGRGAHTLLFIRGKKNSRKTHHPTFFSMLMCRAGMQSAFFCWCVSVISGSLLYSETKKSLTSSLGNVILHNDCVKFLYLLTTGTIFHDRGKEDVTGVSFHNSSNLSPFLFIDYLHETTLVVGILLYFSNLFFVLKPFSSTR